MLYAAFLEELKEERPAVYPLIRTILHLLDLIAPRTSVCDLYEILSDNSEMMDDLEEGEEDDNLEIAAAEVKKYKKHVINMKGTYEKLLRKIVSLHKKVSWELTEKENWFVTTAVQLFESWQHWGNGKSHTLEEDYDESNSMEYFFNVLWEEGGVISDYAEQCWQDFGNYSPPSLTFHVKNKKSLDAIREAIRSFALLEAVIAGGYQIWNLRK